MHLYRVVIACQLALAALGSSLLAQDGKTSSTGRYKATLACGGGVADAPGPNGENYTSVGVQVFDGGGQQISRPVITCGSSAVVGGAGAATVGWYIFVYDKAHTLAKQCQSEPNSPIGSGRFPCKASGNVTATLTLRPE